jgi:hypothetical protein
MINKMAIFEDTVPMCIDYYLFTFIMESFDMCYETGMAMNARESENYLPISHSSSASK